MLSNGKFDFFPSSWACHFHSYMRTGSEALSRVPGPQELGADCHGSARGGTVIPSQITIDSVTPRYLRSHKFLHSSVGLTIRCSERRSAPSLSFRVSHRGLTRHMTSSNWSCGRRVRAREPASVAPLLCR